MKFKLLLLTTMLAASTTGGCYNQDQDAPDPVQFHDGAPKPVVDDAGVVFNPPEPDKVDKCFLTDQPDVVRVKFEDISRTPINGERPWTELHYRVDTQSAPVSAKIRIVLYDENVKPIFLLDENGDKIPSGNDPYDDNFKTTWQDVRLYYSHQVKPLAGAGFHAEWALAEVDANGDLVLVNDRLVHRDPLLPSGDIADPSIGVYTQGHGTNPVGGTPKGQLHFYVEGGRQISVILGSSGNTHRVDEVCVPFPPSTGYCINHPDIDPGDADQFDVEVSTWSNKKLCTIGQEEWLQDQGL